MRVNSRTGEIENEMTHIAEFDDGTTGRLMRVRIVGEDLRDVQLTAGDFTEVAFAPGEALRIGHALIRAAKRAVAEQRRLNKIGSAK